MTNPEAYMEEVIDYDEKIGTELMEARDEARRADEVSRRGHITKALECVEKTRKHLDSAERLMRECRDKHGEAEVR